MLKGKVWELLKIYVFYFLLFILLVIDVYFYAYLGRTILLFASLLMIVAAIISWCMVPTERPNMITALKRNLFIYLGIMLLAYITVTLMTSIDSSQLGISLGLNTGQTQNNAIQGWITMMVQFSMIGLPLAFISYEVKRIWTFYGFGFGHVTKRKRMEQLQKNIVR